MSEERTEAPTARRLHELAVRGQLPRSAELTGALGLLAAVIALQQVSPFVLGNAVAGLRASLIRAGRPDLTAADLPGLAAPMAVSALGVLVGVLVPAAVVALAAGLFQTRGRIAPGVLGPDLQRLNPLAGLRRMVSWEALIGLLWPLLKLAVVALAVQGPARHILETLPTALGGGIGPQYAALGDAVLTTLRNGAGALVVLGIADLAYRRWQFSRQARMTRRELREELRQTEGDPTIRGRIRALQRRLARQRMLHRVPQARVVITNPTHVAVALAYDPREMAAPEVVAKGADLIAQRIIEIARQHRVPIVPNPPLARALYRSVEIGQPIPTALYQAVAEVLAYVFTLRRRGI
ncbi:MAG TPA: EscU/YscU/HrcU family type III secretion system export apparatus switch protein [Isosphaeraceae bacterium]|nr:EscU/YscU/HrcU family type III secretion system export apparatus switch protein [Isosphaeraceae bacterium]